MRRSAATTAFSHFEPQDYGSWRIRENTLSAVRPYLGRIVGKPISSNLLLPNRENQSAWTSIRSRPEHLMQSFRLFNPRSASIGVGVVVGPDARPGICDQATQEMRLERARIRIGVRKSELDGPVDIALFHA